MSEYQQQLQLPPAYALERSAGLPKGAPSIQSSATGDSMDYSEALDNETFTLAASSVLAGVHNYSDATKTVHEMHLALLYLLSNPDEFQKALHSHPPRGATTLSDWNAEYETDDQTASESVTQQQPQQTPLPFVVFADDAEVVLPEAHTASQLFGIERLEGIELEAAAGVPALSQLFLRWLALMPSGDHLNIIQPPGLTVMRIAGGRYRVTAAHRVVWTWMNQFSFESENDDNEEEEEDEDGSTKLSMGDLVSMTIVDVFETDNNGKLLSYCPTFDNRDVVKTTQRSESLRKGSAQFMSRINTVAKSGAASKVNRAAAQLANMGLNAAKSVATSVKDRMGEGPLSPQRKDLSGKAFEMDAKGFEEAMSVAEAAATMDPSEGASSLGPMKVPPLVAPGAPPFFPKDATQIPETTAVKKGSSASLPVPSLLGKKRNEHYISDDDMTGEV